MPQTSSKHAKHTADSVHYRYESLARKTPLALVTNALPP